MSNRLLSAFVLCAAILTVHAKSQATPEGYALGQIRTAIAHSLQDNDGHAPTNWNELTKYIGLLRINEILRANNTEPMEKNYVFVCSLNLLDARGRQVLFMRETPVQEAGRTSPGRYMIVLECADELGRKGTNCRPVVHWAEENNIQEMLRHGAIELPRPDVKAIEEAEIAMRTGTRKRERMDRKVRLSFYEFQIVELAQRIRNWFISPTSTNTSNMASGEAQAIKLKPIPVTLAGVAIVGLGIGACRFWIRRTSR